MISESIKIIGNSAFSGCGGMTSIDIPNSVTSIDYYSFKDCSGLKSVLLPKSIETASHAFDGCDLIKLACPSEIKFEGNGYRYLIEYKSDEYHIENNCLYNLDNSELAYVPCDIDGYTMPESIARISKAALAGCSNLTSLTIPASVKSIGDAAFEGCSNLKTLKADPADVPVVENEGGMSALYSETPLVVPSESTFDYALTFPWSNFSSIRTANGSELQSGSDNVFNYVYLPETKEATLVSCSDPSMPIVNIPRRVVLGVDGDESFYNVVKIADNAFRNHQMQSVTIGENIREIGKSAFEKCANLNEIVFGKNIEIIGEQAFSECTGLTELNFNDNLKYIAPGAFAKCSNLNSVKFNEALDSIGEQAFVESFRTYVTDLEFNRNLKYIGPNAFASTGVGKIEFNEGLERIDRGAFYNCGYITEINLKNGLKSIGAEAFARCRAIENITLPSTLEEIGENAFANMYIQNDMVYNSAYGGWLTGEISINIPASVKHIGKGAFGTKRVKKVDIENLEAWCNISFEDEYSNPMIYCSDTMTINNKKITDLVIPDNITTIKANAFICNNFNSITIPQNVTTIEHNAFLSQCEMHYNDPYWGQILSYDGDKHIENSIPDFYVEDGFSEIEFGSDSFLDCFPSYIYLGRNINGDLGNSWLETLKIGNYVTEIPDNFCSGSSNLGNVYFGSSIKSIGDNAFSGSRLTGVVIPPSVESIGVSAFDNSNLKRVSIGCGIKEIGETAFANNNNISGVYVTALTPPMANNNTFSNYNATLHVPAAVKNDYVDFPRCWYRFENQVSDLPLAERVETNITQIVDAKLGDTYQLTAQVYPAQALQHIFWQSTNPSIAMVDIDGKVTIRDPETAPAVRITPTVSATPGSTAACEIHAYTMYANGPVAVVRIYGDLSGVDDIVADDIDDNAPVEVYNLNGYKVGDSTEGLTPGFYIVRQGAKAKKVYIR